MSKKTKRPSKVKVLDSVTKLLKLDDYTKLEPAVLGMANVLEFPIHGVFVVWKPAVVGSLNFTVIGLDSNDPEVVQDAARALRIVSDDFSQRALNLALQPTKQQEEDEWADKSQEDK